MGDPLTIGLIASAIIGAGGSAYSASQQSKSNRRIAAQQQKYAEETAGAQRRMETEQLNTQKNMEAQANRVKTAQALNTQNQLLALRGIERRDRPSSFAGISQNVLSET